MTKSWNF